MNTALRNYSIYKRVFIVGCPRSGTTLLQSMISGHSMIYSFPETHFFRRLYSGKKFEFFRKILNGYYAWAVIMVWRTELMQKGDTIPIPIPYYRLDKAVGSFVKLLDQITLQNKCKIWVEKTPSHLRFINVITQHIPEAAFIHIIRDGRAVVASLFDIMEQWGKTPSIAGCIRRWNNSIRISMDYCHAENHLIMQYEDLVNDPICELERISNWLKIEFDQKMLNHQAQVANIVSAEEYWKNLVDQPLTNHGFEKYHSIFGDSTQREIESQLDWETYHQLSKQIGCSGNGF